MSLYGSGRAEGFAAATLIGLLVLAVQLLRQLQAMGPDPAALLPAATAAALPALAGILCYRFLRAQGRSRYAAFLGGGGYALAPWLTAMAQLPREQLAAALAPLALEVACRCARPPRNLCLLPFAACGLALPFLAGPAVTALLLAALVAAHLLAAAHSGDLADRRALRQKLGAVSAGTAVLAASLWMLDPLGPWLPATRTPDLATILAAHRPATSGIDLPALLRLAGPVLLMFAALGLFRRQRHACFWRWSLLAALGGLPALLHDQWTPPPHPLLLALPTAAFWLPVLAITVLGTAGLDDFLDHPQRRRSALPWLLALCLLGGPLVPLAAHCPKAEWPLTVTILLLAVLLPFWRRVGILRFKNVLATATAAALLLPAMQVPVQSSANPELPAAPAAEMAVPSPTRQRPLWHYSGIAAVLSASLLALLWSARRRNQHATTTPSKARAAISKKALPPKRSKA